MFKIGFASCMSTVKGHGHAHDLAAVRGVLVGVDGRTPAAVVDVQQYVAAGVRR